MSTLSISLTEQQWSGIMQMLGEANVVPRIAFPLIHALETELVKEKQLMDDNKPSVVITQEKSHG